MDDRSSLEEEVEELEPLVELVDEEEATLGMLSYKLCAVVQSPDWMAFSNSPR
jgi:hypothetical protein